MKLEDVADGERIFVDANILIYHFSRVSAECRSFLARCESGQVEAFTGAHILLEVTHRLMILEALHKGLISGGQPARKLKERPQIIKSLSDYNRSVQVACAVRASALHAAIFVRMAHATAFGLKCMSVRISCGLI